MNSLLEFLTFTKATGYLIAITFIIAFAAFWQLLYAKKKGRLIKIFPLVYLAVGVGILSAGAYSTCAPAAVTIPSAAEVRPSESLVEYPGPAVFPHDMHMGVADNCATCHHHSGDETPSCNRCHGAPFDPENLNMPGLKAAYHSLCRSCHEEAFSSPKGCAECHTKGAPVEWETAPPTPAGPSNTPHDVAGKEDCLICHQATMPTDHAGRTNDTCLSCHKP